MILIFEQMPFFKIKRSCNFMRGRGKSGVGVVDKGADNYCSFMFMDNKTELGNEFLHRGEQKLFQTSYYMKKA